MSDIAEYLSELERLDADEHCSGLAIVPIRKIREWAAENERLREDKDVQRSQDRNAAYEADIKRLQAEVERLQTGWDLATKAVDENDSLRAENARLRVAQALVSEQANDEGLWFEAETCAEAYVQQELRRLHAVIEGKLPEE